MTEVPRLFIAHNLDQSIVEGQQVERWPLHMTLTPPFIKEEYVEPDSLDTIANEIETAGRGLAPIYLEYGPPFPPGSIPLGVGDMDLYGENYDIPVVRVEDPSKRLLELHKRLIEGLGKIGCQFLDLRWANDNYSPHATTKSGSVLTAAFFCNSLSVNVRTEGAKVVARHVPLCEQKGTALPLPKR